MGLSIGHIVWYDEKLWPDTGLVGKWAGNISRSITLQTKIEAPINKRTVKTVGYPGELKMSIKTRSKQTGPRSREFTISMVHYGAYVLRGTTGPIRPNVSPWLVLPAMGRRPSFHSLRYGISVQAFEAVPGQSEDDFLGRAWDTVAATHPALRGILRYN